MDNLAITASFATQMADLRTVQALLEEVLRHLDIREIDGLQIQKWIEARQVVELDKVLLGMGDMNPAAHDALKAYIQNLAKKLRPSEPSS